MIWFCTVAAVCDRRHSILEAVQNSDWKWYERPARTLRARKGAFWRRSQTTATAFFGHHCGTVAASRLKRLDGPICTWPLTRQNCPAGAAFCAFCALFLKLAMLLSRMFWD